MLNISLLRREREKGNKEGNALMVTTGGTQQATVPILQMTIM